MAGPLSRKLKVFKKETHCMRRLFGILPVKTFVELGRLARVSASFGRKTGWQRCVVVLGGGTEQRSVIEETARPAVGGGGWRRPAEEQARGIGGRDVAAAHARGPDAIGGLLLTLAPDPSIELLQCGGVATKTSGSNCTAASAVAMRGGRHYARPSRR